VTLAKNITDTRKHLTDTQAQVEAPFEYAEKLTSLMRRQQEIEDALDLGKGQVGSQPDAAEAPQEIASSQPAQSITDR